MPHTRRLQPQVASLGYHEVTDVPSETGFQRPGALPYKHSRIAFTQHLAQITAARRSPALVTDIPLDGPGHHLLLTFDDGGRSALYIGDELARREWRGHFFIITGRIGTRTFLRHSEIRYLRSCGHIIGTHSHTHPDIFRDLPPARMGEEWGVSADHLAQLLGEPCTAASVPGGHISRAVLRSADLAGLRYLFTCQPKLSPELVGACWVLGRYLVKAKTPLFRIHELLRYRGWRGALAVRQAKDVATRALPALYRRFVDRTTREWVTPAEAIGD